MARSETTKKTTRIQRQKTDIILEAALDVFSDFGFRGSTIDMIANRANLSKPNILYYFDNKEAIHTMPIERPILINEPLVGDKRLIPAPKKLITKLTM